MQSLHFPHPPLLHSSFLSPLPSPFFSLPFHSHPPSSLPSPITPPFPHILIPHPSLLSLFSHISHIIGRAGASPPSRTAGAARHTYLFICTYVSIRRKHSAVKPAITDSGHNISNPMYMRDQGCDLRRDKTDQMEMQW